jgi:hypothetical protein
MACGEIIGTTPAESHVQTTDTPATRAATHSSLHQHTPPTPPGHGVQQDTEISKISNFSKGTPLHLGCPWRSLHLRVSMVLLPLLIPNLTHSCTTCSGIPMFCPMLWSRMHKYARELV